jgi:phage terminase large subunit
VGKWERYALAAHAAGCPADQIRNFAAGGYIAQPKQLEFHAAARAADHAGGPEYIGMGGARGGAKSHAIFAQLTLDDCVRQPGLKALFLRSIGKTARESFEDLIGKVCPHLTGGYQPGNSRFLLPRDSRIILGGFRNENDIDSYLGIEYDAIAVEEFTLLSFEKKRKLRGSLRTAKPHWRSREYNSTNPGGVGHTWYKREFIRPWQRQTENETRFIPATYRDNIYIKPEYIRWLNSLTGWLGRAWRDGDWEIAAGQFFTTWQRAVHVIEPFRVPLDWTFWAALDHGFVHPASMHLFARDGDGMTYLVDEHQQAGWLVERHAAAIHALLSRNDIQYQRLEKFVAGSDIFARRGNSKTSVAQQYEKLGLKLTAANSDRINGAAQVLRLLGDPEDGIAPRLKIFSRCGHLIECLPMLQHNPRQPEDVKKVDANEEGLGGDDAYDSARYGLMELDNLFLPQARVSQW